MTPDSLSGTMNTMSNDNNHPAILGPEDFCFVTGKPIADDDKKARFTFEFDAWISSEGQKVIDNAVSSRMTASLMTPSQLDKYKEYWLIHREWYASDAAPTPQEEEEANAANEEFRSWHK